MFHGVMGRVIVLQMVAAIAAIITANAVIRTVSPSLGEPIDGQAGSYLLALLISLIVSATSSGIRLFLSQKFDKTAFVLSTIASGTFLCFVYAGLAANQNLLVAILGAIAGGILAGFVSLRVKNQTIEVAVSTAAATMGYGLAFWVWTFAIAYLTAGQLLLALCLSLISLAYIGFTISSLLLAATQIKQTVKVLSRRF
jgi:hypothetical protein